MPRGVSYKSTLVKKIIQEYEEDKRSSCDSLSKKHNVPPRTIYGWIRKYSKPRTISEALMHNRPTEHKLDEAMFLISLGVPKTKAAQKIGITMKLLRKLLKTNYNYYLQKES
jgi:transposase